MALLAAQNLLPRGTASPVVHRSDACQRQRVLGPSRPASVGAATGYPPSAAGPTGQRTRSVSASAAPPALTPTPAQQLGGSSLEVPPLGIGAWAWGDKFFWNDGKWDLQAEARAKEAFAAAVQLGIGLVDTAEVYGTKQFGAEDSETLLGRFIASEKRTAEPQGSPNSPESRALVATKFAPLPWRVGRSAVVNACKASLQRLGVPQVDLYQIHWPGVWGNDGFVDGLADCVDQDLVKAVGVSNFNEKRLRRAFEQLRKRGIPLASNQVHYNILYRVPEENGVKSACDELGVTLIAYCPLAQGMLTGKYSAANPPTGPRGVSYSRDFLVLMQPLLQRMLELGELHGGKTLTQVALNWLLSQENIVPIPGAKSRQQVEEFAGALGWRLSEDEIAELRELGQRVPKIQGFPTESF